MRRKPFSRLQNERSQEKEKGGANNNNKEESKVEQQVENEKVKEEAEQEKEMITEKIDDTQTIKTLIETNGKADNNDNESSTEYFGRSRKRSFINNFSAYSKSAATLPTSIEPNVKVSSLTSRQNYGRPFVTTEATPRDYEEPITIKVVEKNSVKNLEITIPFSRLEILQREFLQPTINIGFSSPAPVVQPQRVNFQLPSPALFTTVPPIQQSTFEPLKFREDLFLEPRHVEFVEPVRQNYFTTQPVAVESVAAATEPYPVGPIHLSQAELVKPIHQSQAELVRPIDFQNFVTLDSQAKAFIEGDAPSTDFLIQNGPIDNFGFGVQSPPVQNVFSRHLVQNIEVVDDDDDGGGGDGNTDLENQKLQDFELVKTNENENELQHLQNGETSKNNFDFHELTTASTSNVVETTTSFKNVFDETTLRPIFDIENVIDANVDVDIDDSDVLTFDVTTTTTTTSTTELVTVTTTKPASKMGKKLTGNKNAETARTKKADDSNDNNDSGNGPVQATEEAENTKVLDVMPGFKRNVERPTAKIFGAKTAQTKAESSEKIRLEFVAVDDDDTNFDGPTEKRDVQNDDEEVVALSPRPSRNKSYGRRDRPIARFGSKTQSPSVQENISNFLKRLPSFVPKNKQISQRKNQQQQQQQQIGKRKLKFGERIE